MVRIALISLIVALTYAADPTCIGEDGSPVDWWVIFKAPIISGSLNPHASQGFGYAYLDNRNTTFMVSKDGLDTNSNGALWRTLTQLYSASKSTNAWLMFNDQHPDGKKASSTFAHQKGALLFNKGSGFYLIHSAPRFPNFLKDGYNGFPDLAAKNGQSFMCVTMDYATFNDVGALLTESRPSLYEANLPSSFSGMENIQKVIDDDHNSDPGITISKIKSAGGAVFQAFSKTGKWGKDLYEEAVADTYNTDVVVESWMNGWGPLPTYCAPPYKHNVYNARNISLGGDLEWKETQDHSKWAVSVSSSPGVACIGGINRQNGQLSRGGGTWCLKDKGFWTALSATITGRDTCP